MDHHRDPKTKWVHALEMCFTHSQQVLVTTVSWKACGSGVLGFGGTFSPGLHATQDNHLGCLCFCVSELTGGHQGNIM